MPGRDDGLGVSDHASKVMPMRDAVARFVHDGDTVVIEGFTHLICFAAGHEIIRQRRRDLTLARLTPDVTIVHAQRADADGNTQIWGLLGVQREAAFASKRVIVVVEELVDEQLVRSDPNRTVIPGMIVDAVVVEPWGAHPSYAQGYYDRDNDFYVAWEAISRDPVRLARYLDEFVYGVPDRAAYLKKQPRVARLKAKERLCTGVNYGY